MARPIAPPVAEREVSVSVVVPCRNEAGNIQAAVERIPEMGGHTEILFCDDKSTDGTAEEVRRMQQLYPEKDIRLIPGPGICKAENVWTGFRAARGDVLMILDADLTVMPEELPFFFRALVQGHGGFVNGSRLVYPMQGLAMKFANIVGNKFFSLLFSFLLDQRIKDTLCRHESAVAQGLAAAGTVYRKLGHSRFVGRLRASVRRQQTAPGHRGSAGTLPGAHTRGDEDDPGVRQRWRMLRICWHAWLRLGG